MKRKIVLTGGGSAGHVTPNLVLLQRLLKEGWEIHYIGSKHGIERQLVGGIDAVRYHSVSTGKLRRYWSWENVSDLFKFTLGILQAVFLMLRIKPDAIFSLGGFVAVPVVIGARSKRIPILIFEPDLYPGLANRISSRFAQVICTTFAGTSQIYWINDKRIKHIGPILREELKLGSRARGIQQRGFDGDKPIVLIMGGSQGAERINRIVREALPEMLSSYQVVHICGAGKMDPSYNRFSGYIQLEYAHAELPDLMAMADMVVSRAGSNAIHEWLHLRKPMLLIPHVIGGARTGQLLNAHHFQNAGYAELLYEEELTKAAFLNAVNAVYRDRKIYSARMSRHETDGAVEKVMRIIHKEARSQKAEATI
ncbi:UDP-N-acetylglucosamine-N-acetylmuramylpentapeptide N-acetylglucosamine transferase [Paenibacillaceae bacterium GAS479]|nr:UDP-N-acetylglucosamine-N-acetylmuramylpentapeptide N-acetylglucosamine transferase [Paenibacillaceae bacterium GAS479]